MDVAGTFVFNLLKKKKKKNDPECFPKPTLLQKLFTRIIGSKRWVTETSSRRVILKIILELTVIPVYKELFLHLCSQRHSLNVLKVCGRLLEI